MRTEGSKRNNCLFSHARRPWILPPDHCWLQVRGRTVWPDGTPEKSLPAPCLRTSSALAKPGRWTRTASVGQRERGEERVEVRNCCTKQTQHLSHSCGKKSGLHHMEIKRNESDFFDRQWDCEMMPIFGYLRMSPLLGSVPHRHLMTFGFFCLYCNFGNVLIIWAALTEIAMYFQQCVNIGRTSVWTIWQRWALILVTKPNTSTFLSEFIMSNMASITMKVPVLPTPALTDKNMTCYELCVGWRYTAK